MTTLSTVIVGVAVFVLSQWILKFVMEPILEQRRSLGRLAHAVEFWANVYCNPGSGNSEADEVSRVLREHACDLLARTYGVPLYRLWQRMRFVPKREDIAEAARILIFMSNSVRRQNRALQNSDQRERLKKLLGLG